MSPPRRGAEAAAPDPAASLAAMSYRVGALLERGLVGLGLRAAPASARRHALVAFDSGRPHLRVLDAAALDLLGAKAEALLRRTLTRFEDYAKIKVLPSSEAQMRVAEVLGLGEDICSSAAGDFMFANLIPDVDKTQGKLKPGLWLSRLLVLEAKLVNTTWKCKGNRPAKALNPTVGMVLQGFTRMISMAVNLGATMLRGAWRAMIARAGPQWGPRSVLTGYGVEMIGGGAIFADKGAIAAVAGGLDGLDSADSARGLTMQESRARRWRSGGGSRPGGDSRESGAVPESKIDARGRGFDVATFFERGAAPDLQTKTRGHAGEELPPLWRPVPRALRYSRGPPLPFERASLLFAKQAGGFQDEDGGGQQSKRARLGLGTDDLGLRAASWRPAPGAPWLPRPVPLLLPAGRSREQDEPQLAPAKRPRRTASDVVLGLSAAGLRELGLVQDPEDAQAREEALAVAGGQLRPQHPPADPAGSWHCAPLFAQPTATVSRLTLEPALQAAREARVKAFEEEKAREEARLEVARKLEEAREEGRREEAKRQAEESARREKAVAQAASKAAAARLLADDRKGIVFEEGRPGDAPALATKSGAAASSTGDVSMKSSASLTPKEATPKAEAEGDEQDDKVEVKDADTLWRVNIEAVYRRKNPKLVGKVPELIKKYKDQQKSLAVLYAKVCRQYELDPTVMWATRKQEEPTEDDDADGGFKDNAFDAGDEKPSSAGKAGPEPGQDSSAPAGAASAGVGGGAGSLAGLFGGAGGSLFGDAPSGGSGSGSGGGLFGGASGGSIFSAKADGGSTGGGSLFSFGAADAGAASGGAASSGATAASLFAFGAAPAAGAPAADAPSGAAPSLFTFGGPAVADGSAAPAAAGGAVADAAASIFGAGGGKSIFGAAPEEAATGKAAAAAPAAGLFGALAA
ncbi:unnamed protein product, partial [Prorocentrum cordatum]